MIGRPLEAGRARRATISTAPIIASPSGHSSFPAPRRSISICAPARSSRSPARSAPARAGCCGPVRPGAPGRRQRHARWQAMAAGRPAALDREGRVHGRRGSLASSLLPPETPGASIAGTIALPHLPRWFPAGLLNETRERLAADRGDPPARHQGARTGRHARPAFGRQPAEGRARPLAGSALPAAAARRAVPGRRCRRPRRSDRRDPGQPGAAPPR